MKYSVIKILYLFNKDGGLFKAYNGRHQWEILWKCKKLNAQNKLV